VGQSVLIAELPGPMCFQNTLIRFRANPDIVRPRYAQALFRACLYAGIFANIATQTTSIAHLGVQRFAQLQVPVPSVDKQDRFLADLSVVQAAREAAQAEVETLDALRSQLSRLVFGGPE
jgi:type I restriction enzyme S subunit